MVFSTLRSLIGAVLKAFICFGFAPSYSHFNREKTLDALEVDVAMAYCLCSLDVFP